MNRKANSNLQCRWVWHCQGVVSEAEFFVTQGRKHSTPSCWWFVSYHRMRLVWTKVREIWKCALVLGYLRLCIHLMTLSLSSRHVLCLPFYVLIHRLPKTHSRYLMMEPSGFWQHLLKGHRGWYGSTVPVSNIGYSGGPWWRTMCRQT